MMRIESSWSGLPMAKAREVFTASGVDAPVREITSKAGVGLATFYRHFPERSDLVTAVFRHEVDACADTATTLAAEYEPFEALVRWLRRFTGFVAAKRGLSAALHSGNAAFEPLPLYFRQRFEPADDRMVALLIDGLRYRAEAHSGLAPRARL
jgi:AcrR family transcriptional regulator